MRCVLGRYLRNWQLPELALGVYYHIDDRLVNHLVAFCRALRVSIRLHTAGIRLESQLHFEHELLGALVFVFLLDWLPDSLAHVGEPVWYLALVQSRLHGQLIPWVFLEVRVVSVLNEPLFENTCLPPGEVLFLAWRVDVHSASFFELASEGLDLLHVFLFLLLVGIFCDVLGVLFDDTFLAATQ